MFPGVLMPWGWWDEPAELVCLKENETPCCRDHTQWSPTKYLNIPISDLQLTPPSRNWFPRTGQSLEMSPQVPQQVAAAEQPVLGQDPPACSRLRTRLRTQLRTRQVPQRPRGRRRKHQRKHGRELSPSHPPSIKRSLHLPRGKATPNGGKQGTG